MTFQFRDDISVSTPPKALVGYISELEHALQMLKDDRDFSQDANIRAAFKTTGTETKLLIFLSDGRVHSKDSIFNALYFDPDESAEPKIIDVFVCKMRKKLAGSGIAIITHWGIGYQIEGVDVLKAVIAGQPVAWDESKRIRATEGRQAAPHGEVRDKALQYLRRIVDENGVAETTSRALCAAIDGHRPGAQMIRNLEDRKRLKVLRPPSQKGGIWKLRLAG
jgi:hypothetical protein